ncbi:hypothetical protein S7335_4165 [Synechococcus sp. PCC 7335]|uniref:hypothetical protein n=1 Tax=Synechococcus sp. (strain ATCC 29403 / PCC 7335) TaxID=91464 RepID=UPI00017EB503|nr:hypothetical protein [Synechococcus sp. PCC 7335]EDX86461.1 hypothetical protein S7335_4165 [Synechococcus sp. PCC 7335]
MFSQRRFIDQNLAVTLLLLTSGSSLGIASDAYSDLHLALYIRSSTRSRLYTVAIDRTAHAYEAKRLATTECIERSLLPLKKAA